MTVRPRLTDIAQQAWLPYLRPGSWAIDATAGNGNDTLFLAEAVSPGGHVFALDIQEPAIRATAKRLDEENLLSVVTLVRGDHSRMLSQLPCKSRGQINLICFNLGYLPNGDHAVTTIRETTLPALHEALLLLSPRGALSVIAYRGHEGALKEAEAIEAFFTNLPPPWQCLRHVTTGSIENPGPVWWLAANSLQ